MGYHNEILLILDKESNERFLNLCKDDSEKIELFNNLIKECEKHHNKDNYLYYWNEVKWYDDDPHIKEIEDFLDNLSWKKYLFIRIGEDPNDIEKNGALKDNIFHPRLKPHIEFFY